MEIAVHKNRPPFRYAIFISPARRRNHKAIRSRRQRSELLVRSAFFRLPPPAPVTESSSDIIFFSTQAYVMVIITSMISISDSDTEMEITSVYGGQSNLNNDVPPEYVFVTGKNSPMAKSSSSNSISRKRKCVVGTSNQGHFLVQNRCCYSGFFNTYLAVVAQMPSDFYDMVGKLGLTHFLHNCNIAVNSYHLDDLLGRYIGNHEFKIKDKILKLTVNDVGKILGVPSTGIRILVGRDDETNHETES